MDVSELEQTPVLNGIARIWDCLACPLCLSGLNSRVGLLSCTSCGATYPLINGIPDLRPSVNDRAELVDWSRHWSEDHQQTAAQRFFSFYRKTIFACAVQSFVDRYFPPSGIFIEAGSGTSETSVRIDKRQGMRLLVAIDIVLPVLERCHRVMDVRLCGDIFRLPLRTGSIDGIWNVGVMEHFTHHQIDVILRELHRVLKSGGNAILLWPGTNSVPQKLLKLLETIIQMRSRNKDFHFHPDEISQLTSLEEGKKVLVRNGFVPIHLNHGFKTSMAFKILVGRKT
jgi:SAM-dependent methyltransferase